MKRRLVLCALAALVGAAGVEAGQHQGIGAVRERGFLRVCADPANLPYSSQDPAAPGFEVELARLVARELGVEARLEWHPTFVRALKPLRDGACDLFMGLPRDPRFREGNPWIAVSRPYYVMTHALVVPAGSGARSLDDLATQRVAVELASLAEVHLGRRDVPRGLYRTQAQAFRAVVGGEAAAALLWHPVAAWLARAEPGVRLLPVRGDDLEFPIGAGVRRRDPGLAEAVDAALGRLLDSGQAGAVLERYGATPARPRSRRPPAGDDVVRVEATPAGEAIERGRSLFSTACSRCHGAEGMGGGAGGALPRLRNYDGGWDKFYRIVWNGRKNTAMAGFKGILSPEEIRSLYEYLTSLPK